MLERRLEFAERLFRREVFGEYRKNLKTVLDAGVMMMELIPQFEYNLSKILSPDEDDDSKSANYWRRQKEEIGKRNIASIVKQFGVSSELAKERQYAYNIIKSIPGAGNEAIELVGGIEDVLNLGLEKYGTWTMDVHPRNVMMIFEDGNFKGVKIIDFNRPKYCLRQETDASALDLYLPQKGLDGKPQSNKVFEEFPTKKPFIGTRFSKDQELTSDTRDVLEYASYLPASRFRWNLRNASLALNKLQNIKTFHSFEYHTSEVQHHLELAINNLAAQGAQQGNHSLYNDLMSYINQKYESAIMGMFPKDMYQNSAKYFADEFNPKLGPDKSVDDLREMVKQVSPETEFQHVKVNLENRLIS